MAIKLSVVLPKATGNSIPVITGSCFYPKLLTMSSVLELDQYLYSKTNYVYIVALTYPALLPNFPPAHTQGIEQSSRDTTPSTSPSACHPTSRVDDE